MPISHPIKPHNVQKSKGLRSKRAFGKDLTNQQGRNANNANQKHGSKPSKANEDADLKKDEMKPQLMVVDQVEVAAVDEDGDDDMSEYSQDSQVTPEPVLKEWDAADLEDDLCVPEYAEKIMDSLKQQEAGLGPFMDAQKDVNARMRAVLVDWLIEVHRKFKLSQQTYFLAINMVDRYLADHSMVRTKLQLLGCTCLWIASKYHEIYAPEMDDFVYISDNAFSTEQLTEMEVDVLKTLSFELTVPTVLNYAERYCKVSSHYLKKGREMKIIADLIMYCTEHAVITYSLAQRAPSIVGAACFIYACLSTKVFTRSTIDDDNLEEVVGYTMSELVPTMKELNLAVKNAKKSKHKALYKKYSSTKYSNIGKLNFARLNISFLDC